jgi:hypothetical protein
MTNTIHATTEYNKFKFLKGNRKVLRDRVNALKESMLIETLLTPITVNENYEIIDGQHRFQALKELGKSINYIIQPGLTIKDAIRMNQNVKTWALKDYEHTHLTSENKNYIMFNEFKSKYKFGFNECLTLLTGSPHTHELPRFKNGELKITKLEEATHKAELIWLLSDLSPKGFRRRVFVYAMIHVLNNPNFIFSEFLVRLKRKPEDLKIRTTKYETLVDVENIYNKNRTNKIWLKD